MSVANPGYLLFVFFGGVVDIPFVVLTRLRSRSPTETRFANALIALSIPATVAALLLLSYATISLVRWRATATADSKPFCLQIPADHLGRYKPVTRSGELTGLEMQALFTNGGGSDDFQFAFHALLVVEGVHQLEYYNWSYFSLNFTRVTERSVRALHLKPVCEPSTEFFTKLV